MHSVCNGRRRVEGRAEGGGRLFGSSSKFAFSAI